MSLSTGNFIENVKRTLTGNVSTDLNILRKLDRTTLLKLCESDIYILNLCNDDPTLYKIITAPEV